MVNKNMISMGHFLLGVNGPKQEMAH